MLTLQSFEPFLDQVSNQELKDKGLYGVLLLTNGEWVATEITEDDINKYTHWFPAVLDVNIDDESHPDHQLNQKAKDASSTYSAWPLVTLVPVI